MLYLIEVLASTTFNYCVILYHSCCNETIVQGDEPIVKAISIF